MNSDYWRNLARRAKEFGQQRHELLQRALAWTDRLAVAKAHVASLSADDRWALWQALAGDGRRFYGEDGTIHDSGTIDVCVDSKGTVHEVWFRCQSLPFEVSVASIRDDVHNPDIAISGVVVSQES